MNANISYEKQFIESGLNNAENWKGDPRGRLETMLAPLIEGSEYYFKQNKTDSSSKILELYRNGKGKRLMGVVGKRDMTINAFFDKDFYNDILKSVTLPENKYPKKSQPHVTISLNKLWNVMCAVTGKPDYMTED